MSALELAVAARLRAEIAVRNVGKTKLAEQVGVHRTHLSRVIHGHRHIDVNLLGDLCDALGLDVVEVMDRATRQARQSAEQYGPIAALDELRADLDGMESQEPDAPDERPEAG